jgi:mono/diheme cytochrome c family protein
MQICFCAARFLFAVVVVAAPWAVQAADKEKTGGLASAAQLERGRYLVRVGGCNDCHTPRYMESEGKTPEAQWLTGDNTGWRGPWGTTYAPNLRMYMQDLTEAQWLKTAKSLQTRPPMPWFTLQQMSTADLRAIYAFTRHLGPAGQAAPAYLPPDKEPPLPYVQFVVGPPK